MRSKIEKKMTEHIVNNHNPSKYGLEEMVGHWRMICGAMCRNKRGLRKHKRSKARHPGFPHRGFSPGARFKPTVWLFSTVVNWWRTLDVLSLDQTTVQHENPALFSFKFNLSPRYVGYAEIEDKIRRSLILSKLDYENKDTLYDQIDTQVLEVLGGVKEWGRNHDIKQRQKRHRIHDVNNATWRRRTNRGLQGRNGVMQIQV